MDGVDDSQQLQINHIDDRKKSDLDSNYSSHFEEEDEQAPDDNSQKKDDPETTSTNANDTDGDKTSEEDSNQYNDHDQQNENDENEIHNVQIQDQDGEKEDGSMNGSNEEKDVTNVDEHKENGSQQGLRSGAKDEPVADANENQDNENQLPTEEESHTLGDNENSNLSDVEKEQVDKEEENPSPDVEKEQVSENEEEHPSSDVEKEQLVKEEEHPSSDVEKEQVVKEEEHISSDVEKEQISENEEENPPLDERQELTDNEGQVDNDTCTSESKASNTDQQSDSESIKSQAKVEESNDLNVLPAIIAENQVYEKESNEKESSEKDMFDSSSSSDDDKNKECVYDLFDSSSDEELQRRRLQRQETKLIIHDYPDVVSDFKSLHLHEDLFQNIESAGFEQPTQLQSTCLPQALKWRDCIIQGPPGTGKTTVYVLSTLHLLPRTSNRASARSGVRVLVVCPTREQVTSVHKQYETLSANMANVSAVKLVGGTSVRGDKANIRRMRPNVIIGTPGRIAAALKDKTLYIGQMKTLVLEQADMLLNPSIKEFRVFFQKMTSKYKKKQIILTCTTPEKTAGRFKEMTKDDVFELKTDTADLIPKTLDQYYVVPSGDENNLFEEKAKKLNDILDGVSFSQAVIFTNTGETCTKVLDHLIIGQYPAIAIHGSLAHYDRSNNHEQFSKNEKRILVATDALCREVVGPEVNLVVNFDHTSDNHIHLHRVVKAVPSFRSTKGVGIIFVNEKQELEEVETIYKFTAQELPEDLDSLLRDSQQEESAYKPNEDNDEKTQNLVDLQNDNVEDSTWHEAETQASAPVLEGTDAEETHRTFDEPQTTMTTARSLSPLPPISTYEEPHPQQTRSRTSSSSSRRSNKVHPDPNPTGAKQSKNGVEHETPTKMPAQPRNVMGFHDPSQKGPKENDNKSSCTCIII